MYQTPKQAMDQVILQLEGLGEMADHYRKQFTFIGQRNLMAVIYYTEVIRRAKMSLRTEGCRMSFYPNYVHIFKKQ